MTANARNDASVVADCLRIGTDMLMTDAHLADLLEVLKDMPELVRELSFFTGFIHSPMPLAALDPVAERLKEVLPRVRAQGYHVGIEHLATTGHHDENLAVTVDAGLPRQVGIDGQVCRGALCPASPAVHAYVRETYTMLAAAGPDCIWAGDDLRLAAHWPTSGCCMCASCLADFSELVGKSFSREDLVTAMDKDGGDGRNMLRASFMQRNARVIGTLLALIEETVHAVNPEIELGFMTGDRFWEGYDFAGWTQALQGRAGHPVRWRPRGGFYADTTPSLLLQKAHEIGRQAAALPEDVRVIQSEIENFPNQPLGKARQTNVLEITAYLFAGCTGTTLNILGQYGHQLAEQRPLFEYLARHTDFWNSLKAHLKDTRISGVWPAWDPLQLAAGRPAGVRKLCVDIHRQIADWLSGGTLPVIIHTMARITPWVRRHPDGKLIVGLLNLSADRHTDVNISIRGPGEGVRQLGIDGDMTPVPYRAMPHGVDVCIPSMEPFTFTVLIAGTPKTGETQ